MVNTEQHSLMWLCICPLRRRLIIPLKLPQLSALVTSLKLTVIYIAINSHKGFGGEAWSSFPNMDTDTQNISLMEPNVVGKYFTHKSFIYQCVLPTNIDSIKTLITKPLFMRGKVQINSFYLFPLSIQLQISIYLSRTKSGLYFSTL